MTSLSSHLLRLPTHAEPPADLWSQLEARLDASARLATASGAERQAVRLPQEAIPAKAHRTRSQLRHRLDGVGQALAALAFCGLLTGTGAWAGRQAGDAALRRQVTAYAGVSRVLERQVEAGPAALLAVASQGGDATAGHLAPAVASLAEDGSEPLSAYWVRDEIAAIDASLARHPDPATSAALWRQRNDMLETWLALDDPNPAGAPLDT